MEKLTTNILSSIFISYFYLKLGHVLTNRNNHPMSSQYPVPKWIEQLHAGKEEAYRILFDEYYQMLCVFAMKYIKDKEVAEDIVQDIILELYSRRLRFNTPVALKSFPRRGILSCAKNDRGTLRPCAENLRTDFTGILQ